VSAPPGPRREGQPGLYDERGLLHVFIDYDVPPPWLNSTVDPLEDEGNVQTRHTGYTASSAPFRLISDRQCTALSAAKNPVELPCNPRQPKCNRALPDYWHRTRAQSQRSGPY
jgi:hypothetical protein